MTQITAVCSVVCAVKEDDPLNGTVSLVATVSEVPVAGEHRGCLELE